MATATKKPVSLLPAVAELERCFDALRDLFPMVDKKTARPLIVIQSAGRMAAYGWYGKDFWKNGTRKSDEITLCAEHLKRGVEAIVETLIHEMAHWANWSRGIKDCSSSQYHNAKFRDTASQAGLLVTKTERHGWAKTELSPALLKRVKALKVDKKAFEFARLMAKKKKAPTKMKKWSCGCTNVRCAVELHATCDECGNAFELCA